jgi:hypothetical protein
VNLRSETLPRRAGPIPYIRRRANLPARLDDGRAMHRLVLGQGLSFRHAAATLGLSLTTGWRRYHWFSDVWAIPAFWDQPAGPLTTPQRGTAACPNRRPHIPAVDEPRRSETLTVEIRETGEKIPVCSHCAGVLWSTGSLGRRWDVSAEWARRISHSPGFPSVAAVDGMRRLFCSAEVLTWERRHRQLRDGRGRFRGKPTRGTP